MMSLLLNAHVSPKFAAGLRRLNLNVTVHCMNAWKSGRFLGRSDEECLSEAAGEGVIFVTYDRRTIPRLLKEWREQGRTHAGVVYIDEKTIAPDDIGALVRALAQLIRERRTVDWTDRVEFLHSPQ